MLNIKRGAIELSVTTIVVVVIGITLLSLGLLFVRDTFKSIGDLKTKAFDNANTELNKISHNEEITLNPEEFDLEKKDYRIVELYIANLENEPATFTIKVIPPSGLDAAIAQTGEERAKEYTYGEVGIGEEMKVQIIIMATSKAILGPVGVPIEISSDQWENPKPISFTVNVIKSSGVF